MITGRVPMVYYYMELSEDYNLKLTSKPVVLNVGREVLADNFPSSNVVLKFPQLINWN